MPPEPPKRRKPPPPPAFPRRAKKKPAARSSKGNGGAAAAAKASAKPVPPVVDPTAAKAQAQSAETPDPSPPAEQQARVRRATDDDEALAAVAAAASAAGKAEARGGNVQTAVSGDILTGSPGHPTVAIPGKVIAPATSATLLDAYADDARAAIVAFEKELKGERDRQRVGRLHYEIARLYDTVLVEPKKAGSHYAKALDATPDHLPTIIGARRLAISRGDFDAPLELYDREIRVTPDRVTKAALLFAKGRLLEDNLDKLPEARATYAKAAELCESDPVLLKALEQADQKMRAWARLADDLERTGNAVNTDPRHRAALVTRRARLVEVHQNDSDSAAELYEAALTVDDEAFGPLDALKRLHYERKRWRELIRVLEREAENTDDPVARTMALYRIGQIHAERLGNRKEAVVALERAAKERPVQAVVLEGLARLYEQAGQVPALASTLSRLVECSADPRERLVYLHRIGELCRDELNDADGAVRAYDAALRIDASYIPALRALAPMYTAGEQWDELIAMCEAEAAAVDDPGRRAAAHCRAGEILERIGRRTEAMTHHEKALALDPTLPIAFRALVRLYIRNDEHHKLVELYERSIERMDVERKIEYLFAIGDLYRGPLDDAEQAEYAYRRVLKIRPKHTGAVHALQRVAESSGRFRELVAALELEATMISDQREVVALLHRGGSLLHEQLGERNQAVVRFKRVLEIDAHHLPTLASLGRIYHTEGHWEDLVDIYQRELHVTSDGPGAVVLLHKMGEVYARFLSDTDKAVQCFRKALDLDPRYGPAVYALARILRERGAWTELVTLAELERDSFKDPSSRAMASYRAGEIYEEHLDKRVDAERCFQRAAEMRRDFRPAIDALTRVRSHLKHWTELAEELEADALAATDAHTVCVGLLRAGAIWWDRLGDGERAIAAYEGVLQRDPDNIAALLAVEPLYRTTNRWDRLIEVYRRQVLTLQDPGAKAAALAERARAILSAGEGSGDDLVDCYTAILALRPNDHGALTGLEQQALASTDPRVLAAVDARLAAATTDPQLRSAYLTRQGESLETAGQPQALQTYRLALTYDSHSRSALRGFARLADVLGDGPAMVEAAQREAAVAKHPNEAADALVRSGTVNVDRLGDRDAAIQDFEKALNTWPDHVAAAEALSRHLRERGEFEVLVERFSRAASEAKKGERQSALWIEVAKIYAQELDNLGAALSALNRLSAAQPDNAEALLELARLLSTDRRWDEAITLLRRSIALKPPLEQVREAQYLLATCHDQTGDTKSAFKHYEAALELAPSDRRVLTRVIDLQMRGKLYTAAIDTTSRLIELAENDTDRIAGLVMMATAKAGVERLTEAVDALAEAVALEGPGGRAGREMAKLASGPDHWQRYVEALRGYLANRSPQGAARNALYLEIARTEHEQLEASDQALHTLVEGLRHSGGDAGLRFELAKRLRQAKRLPEAAEQFQYLLMDDVTRVEAWRYLAQTYEELHAARERLMALSSLAVLEEAAPGELQEVHQWQSGALAVRPMSMLPGIVAELFVARDQQSRPTELLAAMAEALPKVRPPDLGRYGVGSRDRMRQGSDHPVRGMVDRVAARFGLEEFDVYVHRQRDRGVVIEPTAKPSVLLPIWLPELPPAQQVFMLAHPLLNLARGIQAIDLFSARELEILLTAAARTAMPSFGTRVASPDVLEDRQRAILRALPRRRRSELKAAAEAYASGPALDIATYVQWAQQSARRVALVMADDLLGSISVLRRTEDLGTKKGIALVRASPVISDLLKVWVSKPAMALRQRAGLVGGGP